MSILNEYRSDNLKTVDKYLVELDISLEELDIKFYNFKNKYQFKDFNRNWTLYESWNSKLVIWGTRQFNIPIS